MAHVDRSEVCATSPLVSISYVPFPPFFHLVRFSHTAPASDAPLYSSLVGTRVTPNQYPFSSVQEMWSSCQVRVVDVHIMVRNGVFKHQRIGCTTGLSGVPRILENTLPPHFDVLEEDPQDWKFYEEYLRTTRININVRQVFPKGFDPQFESDQ